MWGSSMSNLESRVARLEELLSDLFRPGGTLAIRDGDNDPAHVIIGDKHGDVGTVMMSPGMVVKEPPDDRRVVMTSTGIGITDEKNQLRVLLSLQGLLFLDERGQPTTLVNAEGIHKVGKGSGKGTT